MEKCESPIAVQNVSEENEVNQTTRLVEYLRDKKFTGILITGILLIVVVTVPTVLLEMKKTRNKLTATTTQRTMEEEFVPRYNLTLTNTTKWREHGITVLTDSYTEHDTMVTGEDDTIYICRFGENQVEEWKNNFTERRIVAGGKEGGARTDQLSQPRSIIVNKKKNSILICDSMNRRVVEWPLRNATDGNIILSNIDCFGLAIDDRDYLYVSDYEKHEVRRWNMRTYENILVAGGNGPGDDVTRFHQPTSIFVHKDHSVYVVDYYNTRVMKWVNSAKQGILVAGGHGRGVLLMQLWTPKTIKVDYFGNLYVSDFSNSRIIRWNSGASEGKIIIGGEKYGNKSNPVYRPVDFVFDQYSNIYALSWNVSSRLQKFYVASN